MKRRNAKLCIKICLSKIEEEGDRKSQGERHRERQKETEKNKKRHGYRRCGPIKQEER